MKGGRMARWFLIGLLILTVPVWGLASNGEKKKKKTNSEKAEAENKKSASLTSMPVYKPPLRGAPVGRVGGGTRGPRSEIPFLAALVPEHVGLTTHAKPCLYWFLSQSTDWFVEFTLIDDQSIQPLLEKRFDPPVEAGIHPIQLKDEGLDLATGKQYRWFVALLPDPEHRSEDIIAGGAIERIELPGPLGERLAQASNEEVPYLYAERGVWYDALSSISDLIEASPNDQDLWKKRAALLEQVGLAQVADKQRSQGKRH